MANKTPDEMVSLLRTALESNPGVKSISVDGLSATYDRDQLIRELRYWESEAAKSSGAGVKPVVSRINLS